MSGVQTRIRQPAPDRYDSIESRWVPIIALLLMLGLLAVLPGRYRVAPEWVAFATVLLPVGSMIAFMRFRTELWRKIERLAIFVFVAIAEVLLLISLYHLILSIVGRAGQITGLTLLASAIVIWVGNFLLFSLVYWSIDGGGPEARAAGQSSDWYFPQQSLPDRYGVWRPVFLDYLYLAYETATAFSSTDDMPLTQRAKLLMMGESALSLITIVIVAARAVNILG
ncbi:MAG: hypothetical protein JO219_02630 [Candidatus Eremiobacteraeota bacterium]|nr:hypothetical protein [Candidatus Eremiobacteraeota bacterium]MBV8366444.1 hypothetical protein [Candidatus Eremiobacteraeota bacterium]